MKNDLTSDATLVASNPGADQALLDACQQGNAQAIRDALKQGANPNTQLPKGQKYSGALGLAIMSANPEAVGILLEAKASPDICAADGCVSMLVLAASCAPSNQAKILEQLIFHGANPWRRWTDRNDGNSDAESILNSADEWTPTSTESSLWDILAQQFVEQGLMKNEVMRSRLLFHVYAQAFPDDDTEPHAPWRLLAEALDKRVGSEAWNIPIGKSLWANGLHLSVMAAKDGNWPALTWLLDHGADPHAKTPDGLSLYGYPQKDLTLMELVEEHATETDPERESLRQHLITRLSSNPGKKSANA